MKKIDLKDYDRVKEISSYNHNYYKHKINKSMILVECDEYFNEISIYSVEGNEEYFLFNCPDNQDGVFIDE